MLLEVGKAVNDGKELADIIGTYGRLVVEQLLSGGDIDTLVFHHAGVAAAGGIDSKAVEYRAGYVALAYDGHAVFVYAHHVWLGGLSAFHLVVGALEGTLGCFEAVERLVLGTRHTDDLLLAVAPIVVDARLIALPHNVVFLFFSHRIGMQRYEVFPILCLFICIIAFLFVSLHFQSKY